MIGDLSERTKEYRWEGGIFEIERSNRGIEEEKFY